MARLWAGVYLDGSAFQLSTKQRICRITTQFRQHLFPGDEVAIEGWCESSSILLRVAKRSDSTHQAMTHTVFDLAE